MEDNSVAPDFKYLLDGYVAGTLSEQELYEFYTRLSKHEPAVAEKMLADLQSGKFDGQTNALQRDAMFAGLNLPAHNKTRWFRLPVRIAAAASVLLLLFAGGWAWLYSTDAQKAMGEQASAAVQPAILPGGEKALLTLGNGTVVQLDSAGAGKLAQQGAVSVAKLQNGMLSYRTTGHASGELLYNKVSTPKGGVYIVMLPDGTVAYLNAASSIRFPTVFEDKRKVEVTGEVYFEVTKNPAAPFEVMAGGTKVTVYGTHFNFNAYDDEAASSVTLLEGAVSVTKGSDSVALQPGQQAIISAGIKKVTGNVDLDEIMAWKNGLFHFESLGLPEIMRQISRWYDVDITYKGNASIRRFSGIVSRKSSIEEVLRFMQLAGVRFEIDGRNITVIQ